MNKKPLVRKRNFIQTPFSHSALKLEQKNHAAKLLAFSLHFLFRRDQNHNSKMTNGQILKKTAPQYNSNSLNCKNEEHRNIALLSLQLRSYNKTTIHKHNRLTSEELLWNGWREL